MIIGRLKAELSELGKELERWNPDDTEGRRVKELLDGFTERFATGVKRIATETQARQAQENQLEIALCFAEDAVSVTTRDGRIRLVNPAFERLTGYTGPQIIGGNHDSIWSKAPIANLSTMWKALEKGDNWRGELSCLTRNDDVLTTEVTASPIISPKGIITNYVFVQRDITDRVKMERKLSAQKTFLEKVINLSSNLLVVLGPNGEWELDNLAAKTLISDMGKDARKRLAQILLDAIGNEAVTKARKIVIELANGKKNYYMMQTERIPARYLIPDSEAGNMRLITLYDITEIERQNREILVRQKALSSLRIERSLAQDELANGIVYRMRQPLNVALAITSRMGDQLSENDSEGLEHNIELLRDRLFEMEGNLLEFRKITKSDDIRHSRCAIADIFESVEILYRDRLKTAGATMTMERPSPSATVPLAEEVAQSLVVMLMENALESIDGVDERKLRLSCIDGEDEIGVAIEDSGPGVRDEDRFVIFEPFHSTKPGRQGLSLAMLHQIVTKTGGRVEVKKSSLGGAMFELRFPVEAK